MNHEPECQQFCYDKQYSGCICMQIRSSYQRGREDAAKAVEKLRIESFGIMFDGKFYESVLDTRKAIRAARGSGHEG